jgi:hypothetical protein
MSASISSIEHSLASAASDVVKVANFVETSVLPALNKAQAEAPTIEVVTALVSPRAANIERLGFAVLGVVIKAIDDAGTAAGANGLNVFLAAQLVADINSIAPAVNSAAIGCVRKVNSGGQNFGNEAFRKVFGAHSNHVVGFLQIPDDRKLVTQDLSAHLEYTSQSLYRWLLSHNHVSSSNWMEGTRRAKLLTISVGSVLHGTTTHKRDPECCPREPHGEAASDRRTDRRGPATARRRPQRSVRRLPADCPETSHQRRRQAGDRRCATTPVGRAKSRGWNSHCEGQEAEAEAVSRR